MFYKKGIATIAVALVLVGCASPTVTEMRAPDGTALRSVKCNIDSQRCFLAATESCMASGGTYRVISSHSNAGGTLADILPGPVTWYSMTYICGPSDGKVPTFPFRGPQYVAPPVIIATPAPRRSITTNCSRIGDTVNCTSF